MRELRWWIVGAALTLLAASACACGGEAPVGTPGAEAPTADSDPTSPSGASSSGGAIPGGSSPGGASGGTPPGSSSGGPTPAAACSGAPPSGATLARPLPAYTSGACPALVRGENTITSAGHTRKFLLAAPSKPAPGLKLPVVFLWHWLGGSAQKFFDTAEVQSAVEQQGFIAIAPVAKGDLPVHWPSNIVDSSARQNEEYLFFDDMLACAAAQFSVNENCISTAGVSAGALFVDQLASGRADRLASVISLSGGVGGVIKPWGHPSHRMPAMVLWGGPGDTCGGVLSFADLSRTLEDGLAKDGSFILECVHNCGHAAPPFEAPAGLSKYAGLWDFAMNHPYWLAPGESPFKSSGVPSSLPSWCGIGKGSAVPRTGACVSKNNC